MQPNKYVPINVEAANSLIDGFKQKIDALEKQLAQVDAKPNYSYRCVVTRVVDGDTCDVDIDLGFNEWRRDRVRLMGIDTPESRTRNKKEKVLGLASKARFKEIVKSASLLDGKRGKKNIYLKTTKEGKGKFGRILGTIYVNDTNVNEQLMKENHARPYYGGSKNELGEWVKETNNTWYRWTPGGYVEFDS